ncbi:MAG: TRAP transporter large permease [Sedimentibacter sp.]
MELTMIATLGITALLFLLFFGMNIGLAMLFIGFLGYATTVNLTAALGVLQTVPATQASAYSLSVIPLFILMGNLAFAAGMSEGLFNAGNKWLGRLPGGLACGTIAACAGFGAICGSTAATTATMGVVSIPEMRKYGYSDELATGAVSIGGTLGIMIPPSTPMIIYGIVAEVSIGRMFSAGIIPGLVLAVVLILTVVIQVKMKPELAPASKQYTLKEKLESLKGLTSMIILFAGVFIGMFSGLFTINEAAAFGSFLALIIMIAKGKCTKQSLKKVMFDTIKTTAMCYLMLIGATVFGNFLAITQVPMKMASYIGGLNVSRYVILSFVVLIYAFLGCLMDALPMVMLTVPIFLPIMTGLGFDPIWFGIIIILVMELGLVTPPVGMNCYIVSGIAKDVPLSKIFKGSLPFTFAVLIVIIIVTLLPSLVTFLPTLIYG